MPKIQPAVTQLSYNVPAGTSYIDLARDLSRVNRRLYRQGYVYAIQDITVLAGLGAKSTDTQSVAFYTTGNSWIVHNAWKKAYETWRKMQNEYADGQGANLKGKWADFKIYLDDSMAAGTILSPMAGDGAAYDSGEWIYSNFVYDDAGTARSPTMHMIGSVTADSAIGLIEAYANSRNYQLSEPGNTAEMATGFYAQYHGVGDTDDELGDDLRNDNDLPPYELDDYPGGDSNADAPVWVRAGSVTAQQASTLIPGFIAPCGLIQIHNVERQLDGSSEYEAGTSPTMQMVITLAPGPYRGVMATRMGQ